MGPLRSATATGSLPRPVFHAVFAAAAASAFTVDVAIERDLVLHANAAAEGEVVLSEAVDDWTLLRCASLSSAVVVAHRGVRARYCPRHRLTWLPNPHETSLPLSYVANACARLGQRPCRYRELCSDPDPALASPARTDNHTTSLVVTAEGAAVDVGEPGGTCTRSLDAGRSHFGNTTAQYRTLCCAEDLCDPLREGDVVVPPGHASSYPTLLSLRWSRRGHAVVRCEAYRGGSLRGSFDVRVRSLPPPDAGGGVVLERSPVYLHPGQEAHLSVRLSGPPATGRALVRCWTSAGGRVEGRVLSFTDATFAVAQRLELRWDDAWSVAAGGGGGTETVVCTYNGADVGGVGKVVRRVGAALRLVDAAGGALPRAAPLVLAEDAAVLGFGLEVTGVPSRAANPEGWPTSTHQAACELLPGSDRLLLLRPVPLEFAGPATLWFAVVRGRRQFSEYTVRLRCRNGRAPSAGFGTLWELHPDEAAVERDVVVRVPRAVNAHRARLALAAPAALAKGGTAALELLMTRRPVQPTRVTCRASSDAVTLRPSAAAHFVGVVEEREAAAEPLLTGSTVAFRYSGPQHRYNGTQWLSCEGGAGGQACRLAACAGDEMDGEEWGACAAATFVLHAARPPSDRHHPLQPRGAREAVRNGDLVLLAAPDALNATVTCATATDRCVPGDACAASFPPLRGDYVSCNSTFRLWAAGRVEGDAVRRGDAVSLLWAPASAADSAAAGDRWMGCLGASEEVVSDVGERQCSAAFYDTCPGHTPQEGAAFALPEACASYGFALHTLDLDGGGATPPGWGLYSYATDAPLSRPLLGEAPVWRRVGGDVASVGAALSGASASVLLRGGGGDDVRLTLGRNGTYALRAAAPRWLRRGRGVSAGCVEDYAAVLGTPAECRERCENTTGCAFVSFPHWDGCRVHMGTQPSCMSVDNGSAVATPTQTATLAPVSEAEEALYAPPAAVGDWNGALEVGGGRIVQVLQPGTPLLDVTFDAWVRPVAAAAAWTLRDADTGACLQRRGGDCNETWAAAPLPNNSVALSMSGGFCAPRDACGTPVQWLPGSGGADGYLVLPERPGYCVDAAGAAVDDATFAGCARWVRTVGAGAAETPLVATTGTRSALGTGLFLSSAGVVSLDVGDGGSRVSVASPPLPAGEWAHVAGVVDRVAGRARLYVDGTLAGAVATGEVAGVLSPTVLWMGGEAATRAFVDNVAVWRAPLSAEQALQRTLCRAVRGHDLLALAVSFTFRNGAISDAFGHASYAFGAVVDPLVRGAACDGFNAVRGWRPAGVGTLLPAAAEGACEARCLADAECAGFARDAATGDCDLLSGVSFAGPYADVGVSWHAKAPSLLRRAPRRRRVAAEAVAEASCSSVSERNSTCAMAVDGVRGPAYVGEWASRSETVGAWLTLRLAAPHTLTHVRVAQRAYGAAQAKQVRVCVEGGGGGRSCVVRTLAPATAVHPVPRWEDFELGGSEEATLVTVSVETVHTAARTRETASCAAYVCPGVATNGTAAPSDCGGACTTLVCCDDTGVGFQEVELYGTPSVGGRPAGGGVLGEWCRGDVVQNHGVAGSAFAASRGRPYETLVRQSCLGSDLLTWADTLAPSLYGRTDLTLGGCVEQCDGHPECHGFDFAAATAACAWRGDVVVPGNYSDASQQSCLLPNLAYDAPNGTVLQSYVGDSVIGNASACSFEGGALAVPHLPAPLPLSLFAWVRLRAGCNETSAPIVSWSSAKRLSYTNTFSLEAGGALTWRVENGSRQVDRAVFSSNATDACDGRWHSIGLAVGAEGDVAFFVDGAEVGADGESCCSTPHADTDLLALGAALDKDGVTATLDGLLHGVRIAADGYQPSDMHDAHRSDYEPTATALPGGLTYAYRKLQGQQMLDASLAIRQHTDASVDGCQGYCSEEAACAAVEYATTRVADAYNTTAGTCTLYSAAHPRGSAAAQPGSTHLDLYVRGGTVLRRDCGVVTLRPAGDTYVSARAASAVEANATTLVLADAEDAVFLRYDLATLGLDSDDVASALLTLPLADAGLLLYYTLDNTTRDGSGRADDAALGVGVSFTERSAVGVGSALFAGECPAIVGPPVESLAELNETSLMWSAWVKPSVLRGDVVTVDGTLALYFDREHLYCKVWTARGEESVRTTGVGVVQPRLWQHVGCRYSGADGAKTLDVLYDGRVVASRANLTALASVEGTRVRVGCSNATYAGYIDDVRVYRGELSSAEVEAVASLQESCVPTAGALSISAVEAFDDADVSLRQQPAVLLTVTRALAGAVGSGGAVTVDVTGLLRVSPYLRVAYASENNCSSTLRVQAREANEIDQQAGAKLSVVTGCEAAVGTAAATACETCWPGVMGMARCDDASRLTLRNTAAGDLRECLAHCESDSACKGVEWDATSGNCTTAAALCREKTLLTSENDWNETLRAFVVEKNAASDVLRTPATVTFDVRDAFLPSPDFTSGVLLRLHVQAAAHAVRDGDCSLVATGPSGASVAHPIADVRRGDVLLLDVGHIVGAEGAPLLDFALSTECNAAGAAANASLSLWSRNHASGLLPPALLLHAPGFEGSVGVRSADTAEAAGTLRHGHAGLQVRFAVGDRLHRDVRLAWLRLPLGEASACREVDVRLLDAEGGAVRALRGLPLRDGVPFEVTALVAETAAGSESVAFEVQAACIGRTASVDAAAHATLQLLYDASAEVLRAAGAGGADDMVVVGEDTAATLSFGAAPCGAAAGLLLMPVVATDAGIARCAAVTVRHASGGTGYLSAPLAAGAGTVAAVSLRPLLPLTPLNVALQLLRDDCSGYAHSFNVSAAVVVLRRGPYTRSVPGCLPAADAAEGGLRLAGTAGCREQDGEWAFLTDGVRGRRRLDVYGSFHPKRHEDFTVGFYFASPEPFDVTPSGTAGWLFNKAVGAGGTAAAAAGVGLRVGPGGSTLELVPGRNASGAEVVPVPAGFFRAWHRYVVVRRQAQLLLYVDGVLLAAYVPASPPATRDAGPTRFGGAADGTMEVRGFFSRLVLSHAAATGAALDGLFDSVLYEHVQAEVRGFGQSGLEYATSAGGCTQWYSTILVGTVPRCMEACALSQACAMFSYDPVLRRCRVHAAGPTCVPRDRGTGEVLYSKRRAATMVTPRGLSTVDSVWVSWNASTIVVGRGMSEGRHVLLTGVNEAVGPKSVALVQDDAGPQGHGWLFVEASPSERKTLTLEASATREVAGNAFTVTCTPDPTPEMVGAVASATVAYVTPGDCAGMVGGGAGTPLYPCTVAVEGGSRAILFVLRGDSDVEVVLSEEPRVSACSDARAVTLQIDRRAFGSSQVTSVQSGMCGSVLASAATDLITLGRAEWFWVTYTGGVVAFGRGQAAGEDVVLTAPLPYSVRVSYVHVGTSGTAAVTADVYSSPRVVLSLPSLTVYPQRAQSVELSLSVALFNSSVAVEVACDVYPTGIARVDSRLLSPFSAGDEQGARRSHFVTVTYLAAGGTFLRCWPSDTPPYHPSSVVSIPVTAVGTRPAGVGFVEDVLAISKWTEAHAHLHFGSVRLPLLRGELLHVARPEVIADLRVGYGGVYNGTTLPGYSQEHCAMEFSRLTPGFAVAAPPLDSLTFAATFLAADCDVDSTVAQECCPLMTTGWVEDTVAGVVTDVQATSATLAVCGAYEARTLRFGVQRVRGHSVDFYYDVATPLNDTMTDVLAVKDAVTDTLSLYVDGRLVDHSTAGGTLPIGTEAKGSEVVVGGGCFWREAKDAASTCPVLASTSASTLQECVDYAQGVAFANAVSLSYGASTCLVQNCTRVQREVHLQVEASPGNTTASLTSCSKAGFAGHVRRVRAWPRAVGCGEAFEEIDAGLRAAVDASDCDAVAGDHDRLRGGLAANEPNSDFEARCTVLDTSVVRLRQEHQVFSVPREEYGSLYSLPVEYVGPGRTELRCELGSSDGTHLALNQTGAAFVPVVDVVTIFASDAPGWTRLPDMPTGLLGGCSVVVGGTLHVFAGNTAMRFAGGRWEGLAGSGVAFDGCGCLPVVSGGGGGGGSEEEVLLFGCPHGVVLSYVLRTRRFQRRAGYPPFEGYQRQSPMQLGRGALVYDSSLAAPTTTASGAFVSLRFDTRTVQRRRNPAEPALDPMLAQPLVVESRSEAGADVYYFGEAAHRSNATRGSWGGAVAAGLDTHARDLWWSQRGLGSFVLNLCAGAALLGGLDAAASALSPAMLPLYAADPRTGDAAVPAAAAAAYPPLSRGVVGGTAAAGGGHVYHLGGLQAPSAEERFCAYDTRVGNGTDTVWRCAHELGAAAGVAGSLVVGFKMTDTFTAFSVGLAHSVCNDTLAQPATNERVGWNPCNGYVRVTVTREAVSVLQLQGGVESTVASMPIGVYAAVLGHHRRYLWIRWQRRNQAWRVIVGRGAHIGSNRVLTAAPPEQVYLNEAAYYYTTNDTYPTAKEGLGIHSIASGGSGDRSAQMLTHLSQFGMAACGQQGSCESSSGTCDCYNPNKRGTQCQECAADRQGPLCGDYKPCGALYPHQPHKAEECAAWRDRGCRSVAHDARFFLPSLNQTIRRFRLNSE